MHTFTRIIAATIGVLTFTAAAHASPQYGGAGTQISPSIIMLGKPLDCKVDVCPKDEAEEATDDKKPAALVDAAGMPTKMPTVLRGGQSSDPDLTFTRETETVVAPTAQSEQAQGSTPQESTGQPASAIQPQATPASAPAGSSDGPPVAPAGIKVE